MIVQLIQVELYVVSHQGKLHVLDYTAVFLVCMSVCILSTAPPLFTMSQAPFSLCIASFTCKHT